MTTLTEPKAAEIADVVCKAGDVVYKNGHHKGYLYDEAQADEGTPLADCRVDAVGAINTAVFGKPRWPAEDHAGCRLAEAAVTALEAFVGKPVPGWNDDADRDADDIIAALWDTAAGLRKEAA
ncbi:MAG: hypothetical protein HOZ81_04910 [Streptomyces sp.]|nr:hypothetical protein [Streptomyces sp.]